MFWVSIKYEPKLSRANSFNKVWSRRYLFSGGRHTFCLVVFSFFFKSPFKMHLFDLYIYITCGGEEGRTDHIRREIQSWLLYSWGFYYYKSLVQPAFCSLVFRADSRVSALWTGKCAFNFSSGRVKGLV